MCVCVFGLYICMNALVSVRGEKPAWKESLRTLAEGFNPPVLPYRHILPRSERQLPVLIPQMSPDSDTRRVLTLAAPFSQAGQSPRASGYRFGLFPLPRLLAHPRGQRWSRVPTEWGLKCRSQLGMRLDAQLTSAARLIRDEDRDVHADTRF